MNARADLRILVEGIRPLDDMEAADIRAVLAWIDLGAPLYRTLKPATPPRHLVSYFLLVDGEHLLLVDHIDAGLWLPTGGHVEPDEHPAQTVRREAWEELGLDCADPPDEPVFLTVTETVGRTAGHVDVSLWYVLKASRCDPLVYDASEFGSVQWFHKDQIPLGRSDPHMARVLRKLFPDTGRERPAPVVAS